MSRWALCLSLALWPALAAAQGTLTDARAWLAALPADDHHPRTMQLLSELVSDRRSEVSTLAAAHLLARGREEGAVPLRRWLGSPEPGPSDAARALRRLGRAQDHELCELAWAACWTPPGRAAALAALVRCEGPAQARLRLLQLHPIDRRGLLENLGAGTSAPEEPLLALFLRDLARAQPALAEVALAALAELPGERPLLVLADELGRSYGRRAQGLLSWLELRLEPLLRRWPPGLEPRWPAGAVSRRGSPEADEAMVRGALERRESGRGLGWRSDPAQAARALARALSCPEPSLRPRSLRWAREATREGGALGVAALTDVLLDPALAPSERLFWLERLTAEAIEAGRLEVEASQRLSRSADAQVRARCLRLALALPAVPARGLLLARGLGEADPALREACARRLSEEGAAELRTARVVEEAVLAAGAQADAVRAVLSRWPEEGVVPPLLDLLDPTRQAPEPARRLAAACLLERSQGALRAIPGESPEAEHARLRAWWRDR
ncbi:MAG: hypothetical protein AB7T09_37395 [Planctomycetota bacterium]